MADPTSDLIRGVADYYSAAIGRHGATPRGVDWNGDESQVLRFEQLTRIADTEKAFSVNDLGCGYGAYFDYLAARSSGFAYNGFDVSEAMIEAARDRLPPDRARLVLASAPDAVADFGVASGIFNVTSGAAPEAWERHIEWTLDAMDATSRRGFAFNCLTSYSDADRMLPHLHYSDPGRLFDLCKRRYAKDVALLHDYGLYEFTILVRKRM